MSLKPEVLIPYAMKFVGVPYRWAGSNPISGFDCSGLMQEMLAAFGADPPEDQTAQALYNHFKLLGCQKIMGPGALVFYGKSITEITHVVMMLNDWQAIGANGGGSKTTSAAEADRLDAFVKVRPIDYRKDIVAILMPEYREGL